MENNATKQAAESILAELSENDRNRMVKAVAIEKLGRYKNPGYSKIFKKAINDSSYTVSGNALLAYSKIDSVSAIMEAKRLSKESARGVLDYAITSVLVKSTDESSAQIILARFNKMPLNKEKFDLLPYFASLLAKSKNTDIVKAGVDQIIQFRDAVPQNFKSQTTPFINGIILKGLLNKKIESGLVEQANYIKARTS